MRLVAISLPWSWPSSSPIADVGRANAPDVRALKPANGELIERNSASVDKSLREKLRDSACTRFSTVLGNVADAYHESHVHLDLMERRTHQRIGQWDVLDSAEMAALAAKNALLQPAGTRQVPLRRPSPTVDAMQ